MKFNNLLQEASQEIIQQFNSFFDEVSSKKDIEQYGSLRMREVYMNKSGYIMQFQLKPEYSQLPNNSKEIKYIENVLLNIAKKYNSFAKIKRENANNNQAVMKIIFKEIDNEVQQSIK